MRTDSARVEEMMGGPFDVMRPSLGEFHANNGLTFTRTDGHGIMVRLWHNEMFPAEPSQKGWHFRVLAFLDDATWDSITAAIRGTEGK